MQKENLMYLYSLHKDLNSFLGEYLLNFGCVHGTRMGAPIPIAGALIQWKKKANRNDIAYFSLMGERAEGHNKRTNQS